MGYIHNKNFQKFEGLQAIQELILPYLADPTDTLMLTADPVTGVVNAQAIPSGGGFVNPMTTLGDIMYEDATPAAARLAGNTTTTKKFLTQTGNGTISAVPVWDTIVAGDIPLTSTQIAFGSSTNTMTSSANIVWDETNKSLKLNAASTSYNNVLTIVDRTKTQARFYGWTPTTGVTTGVLNGDNTTSNGSIALGDHHDYQGFIGYLSTGNTILTIGNTWDNAAAEINFKLRTFSAANAKTALRLFGSGYLNIPTVPATYSSGSYDILVRNQTSGNIEVAASGFGSITADNGLTASTSTNVQLGSDTSSGSPLLHTTFINVDSYSLIVSGNTLNGSLIGINANATNGYGVQGSGFVGGGFSSPDYPIEIGANKTTNTIQSVITIIRTPTGGGAAGLGSSIDFTAKNSTSSGYPLANQIISKLTNAVAASATSQFIIRGLNNAVAGDILTLNGNKSIQFNGYGSGTNSGTAAKWLAVDSSGNVIEENAPSGGGGLSDGDYGDITVGGTGTTMTIDSGVVTYAKIQDVSTTNRILGRITAGSGDVEELTAANVATIINSSLDHGTLAGLTDDDHTQYALLAGRSGGQTLIGGTAAGNDLTLQSTSNGTKGSIFFGTSEYDEVNNRLGINVTSPSARGHLVSTSIGTGTTIANALYLQNTTAAANNSQQYSPALILEGKGWKTAATAASQAVAYSIQTQPVQAVTNPQANLVIAASINGGAYGTLVTINDQGSMTVSGAIYATSSIGTNAQMCVSTTTNVPQSYRTTNGGSNLTPYIWVGDNATVTAGTPAIAIEGKDKTGGLLFCAANGTRQIARASINIGSLTNTAGSETGDLIFSTQTAGGAVAERFRIAAAGASTFQSSVTASSFVKSGGASTEALMANGGVQTVTSGTYTPTLSSGTNITSQTIYNATYIRVGSAVTVSGRIAINVTASGSVTFRMSLPVASTFSALGQGEGLISSQDGSDTGVVTETAASTTTVQMIFTATASGTKDYSYHYTYTII